MGAADPIDVPGVRRPRPALSPDLSPTELPPGVDPADVVFDVLAHAVLSVEEGPEREVLQERRARRRIALGLGDLLGGLLALGAALALGVLTPGGLLLLPLVLLVAGTPQLAERDALLLRCSTLDDLPRLAQAACLTTLAAWLLQGATAGGDLPPVHGAALLALLLAGLAAGRTVGRAVSVRAGQVERVLLVGDEPAYQSVRRKLQSGHRGRVEVVAFLPLGDDEGWTKVDLYGALDDMHGLIERFDIHRVVLAPVSADSATTLELVRLAKAAGVRVSVIPRLFEVVGSSVVFDSLEGLPVLGVRRFGLSRGAEAAKRALDLVVCGSAFLLVSPVMALIALAVRLDSPGPVLFRQLRIGRCGEPFEVLKFRTMDQDAEARRAALEGHNESEGLFKMRDDPRITRVGRLLRRSSLDELPQLLNVLRGEMSVVGPRPLIPEEDGRIRGWSRRRLELKPGMTGPWQLLGPTRVPLQEMAAIDYLYLGSWTLWADVKILARTAAHVLARRGA